MPYAAPMRLEADGLSTLYLNQPGQPDVAYIDIGDPVTREVVDNAPDANGTIDTTRYFGARSVTLTVVLEPESGTTLWELRNRLKGFTRPDLRPKLFIQIEAGAPEIMLTLRRSGWSEPWSPEPPLMSVAQVQWVCPSGLLESAELHAVEGGAGGEVAQTGLTFNATPNFSFGGSTQASGGALATNAGNVPVWPVVTMYGPFSAGTILRNDTTDQQLEFVSSMSIVTGDYLRIDFAAKTIVNSSGTSYYDSLDFADSTWWQLQPGDNRIYMLPTTFTAPPAAFLVEYRDGYL